jgi:hypothetical protein
MFIISVLKNELVAYDSIIANNVQEDELNFQSFLKIEFVAYDTIITNNTSILTTSMSDEYFPNTHCYFFVSIQGLVLFI